MGSRVSVVVTCHNYGRYLRECLESVLAQDRPADEIIVVDDASTDDTPAIAAEYAPFGVRYERVDFRDACLSYSLSGKDLDYAARTTGPAAGSISASAAIWSR